LNQGSHGPRFALGPGMSKACVYGLLLSMVSLLMGCDQGPCRPRSYGKQCTTEGEGDGYRYCVSEPDHGGAVSIPKYTVSFRECPSWQPVCSTRDNTQDPDIICIGERLEPCGTPGFVRCENLEQVVVCVPQEDDTLVESRGACGEGHVCLPPEAGETDWSGGCFVI
jgi:hypothetical protein